ncbi:Abi-alpha family protein [Methylobacterium sp. Leaf86]|uniref:Abi-alpha family protein n=1 Tax=Methylobacterium sp. Leaf86 TaxID=1736242 RepID=UPI000AEE8A6B|nr:Abi-alpha family protein [Methylobacterium sp. Leaf86]
MSEGARWTRIKRARGSLYDLATPDNTVISHTSRDEGFAIMPLDEEAKAVQEVAKASGEAIKAARDAGGFISRFIAAPLETASDILNDKLRYARWERQQRLVIRGKQFLAEAGLSEPNRRLPLNFAVPLLEAATLEEDDELQDAYARLLVNAANLDSGIELRRTFISILENLNSLDVKILDMIVNAPESVLGEGEHGVQTAGLPNRYISPSEYVGDTGTSFPPHPNELISTSLWNIIRLGCIVPVAGFSGPLLRSVYSTPLGASLVKACTIIPVKAR